MQAFDSVGRSIGRSVVQSTGGSVSLKWSSPKRDDMARIFDSCQNYPLTIHTEIAQRWKSHFHSGCRLTSTISLHQVLLIHFSEVNVTCGKNEMWINLPKSLLRRVDRKHLRLLDANCSAQETRTHFILYTKLTECQTVIKHTSSFAYYMNKVLEIPLTQNQIITRVREVEIPFTCYYSNTGVVSAVGIKAQSKKILFSKNGFGKFVLEMSIYPDGKYVGFYTKKDFPLIVPPRKKLFVQVRVDSEDKRLTILADECFATPDVNPYNPGLKYTFIKDGYEATLKCSTTC